MWKRILSFYHVDHRDGFQIIRLGDKHMHPLRHLAGTQISLMDVWDYSETVFLCCHCT